MTFDNVLELVGHAEVLVRAKSCGQILNADRSDGSCWNELIFRVAKVHTYARGTVVAPRSSNIQVGV